MREHHPSCRESDKSLVWLCAQCGGHESAEDQLAAAYKQGYNDCDCELNGNPATDWKATVTIAFTELQAGQIGMDVAYRRINDAHNAELAAEREKNRKLAAALTQITDEALAAKK